VVQTKESLASKHKTHSQRATAAMLGYQRTKKSEPNGTILALHRYRRPVHDHDGRVGCRMRTRIHACKRQFDDNCGYRRGLFDAAMVRVESRTWAEKDRASSRSTEKGSRERFWRRCYQRIFRPESCFTSAAILTTPRNCL